MTEHSGVAATAVAQSRLAAFLWRSAGDLRLGVVLKATFRMHHQQRMERIAPEPFLVGDAGEPADDLIPFRQTADVWVVGWARRPRDESEAMVRLWVSQEQGPVIDRVVPIDRAEWQQPGQPGRLAIGRTPVGPLRHPSTFETAEGVIDLPADTDYERFQWAPPEQRVVSLTGREWIGVSGAVLEPDAVISQLPRVRATARVYYRDIPSACREVPMIADLIAIDAGAWTCSVTWHGQVDIAVEGERGDLHVVGGVAVDDRLLMTTSPFANLKETLRDAEPNKAATLPFRRPSNNQPPPPIRTLDAPLGAQAAGETMESVGEALERATPFEAPWVDQAPPAPSSQTSLRHRRKLGTTMIEAFVQQPATPFEDEPRRPPSVAPPPAFTSVPPSSLKPSAAWAAHPHASLRETMAGNGVRTLPATPFDPPPQPRVEVPPPAAAAATTSGPAPPDPAPMPVNELSAEISPASATLDSPADLSSSVATPNETRGAALPFARTPAKAAPVDEPEAPKSDLTVMPFRSPKKGLGAAFLAAWAAIEGP